MIPRETSGRIARARARIRPRFGGAVNRKGSQGAPTGATGGLDGADEISITLQDNTTLKASVVGRDESTDLALLRVKPDKPLPYVEFGDSDAARVGDWVLAIGNPFGLGGSEIGRAHV